MSKISRGLLAALLFALTLTGTASAQMTIDGLKLGRGLYGGASVVGTSATTDTSALAINGFNLGALERKMKPGNPYVEVGYMLDDNIGVAVGLGPGSSGSMALNGTKITDWNCGTSIALYGVGRLPFSQGFGAVGEAGAIWNNGCSSKNLAAPFFGSTSVDSLGFRFSGALEYCFTQGVCGSVGAVYNATKATSSLNTGGVVTNFESKGAGLTPYIGFSVSFSNLTGGR